MNQQKGFSLVEVMVAAAISSLLMFAIMSVLRDGQTQIHSLDTELTLETSARNGMTKMIEEVRESAPSRITVTSSSLEFQIPSSVDTSGNITWSPSINYAVTGTQLLRTVSGSTAVIANDVNDITFTANDTGNPTLITIEMDMQREAIDGHLYRDILMGQAKIRNE